MGPSRIGRNRISKGWEVADKPTRAEFDIAVPVGVTEDDVRRGLLETVDDLASEVEFSLGGGVGQTAFTLEAVRQKRVRFGGGGPGAVVETLHPEGVKLSPGGLQSFEDLDGEGLGFGILIFTSVKSLF